MLSHRQPWTFLSYFHVLCILLGLCCKFASHVLYGLCQYKEGVIIPNHAYKLKVVYKANNYGLVMKTGKHSFTQLMVYTNWNKLKNYQAMFFFLIWYHIVAQFDLCPEVMRPAWHQLNDNLIAWGNLVIARMMCQQPLIWCVVQLHLLHLWFANIYTISNLVRKLWYVCDRNNWTMEWQCSCYYDTVSSIQNTTLSWTIYCS